MPQQDQTLQPEDSTPDQDTQLPPKGNAISTPLNADPTQGSQDQQIGGKPNALNTPTEK